MPNKDRCQIHAKYVYAKQKYYLNFEGEIFLHVLDNHDEIRQFDAQGLLGFRGTRDVRGGHIGAHNLQHERLNVRVRDPLDVTIPDLLVPNLQRLRTNTVQDGQEARLKRVLEHDQDFNGVGRYADQPKELKRIAVEGI